LGQLGTQDTRESLAKDFESSGSREKLFRCPEVSSRGSYAMY
jgi:hypothetical protein